MQTMERTMKTYDRPNYDKRESCQGCGTDVNECVEIGNPYLLPSDIAANFVSDIKRYSQDVECTKCKCRMTRTVSA